MSAPIYVTLIYRVFQIRFQQLGQPVGEHDTTLNEDWKIRINEHGFENCCNYCLLKRFPIWHEWVSYLSDVGILR